MVNREQVLARNSRCGIGDWFISSTKLEAVDAGCHKHPSEGLWLHLLSNPSEPRSLISTALYILVDAHLFVCCHHLIDELAAQYVVYSLQTRDPLETAIVPTYPTVAQIIFHSASKHQRFGISSSTSSGPAAALLMCATREATFSSKQNTPIPSGSSIS